ncbi:hypothetical protein IFM89_020457 [Coptis chinensis]|uniref:IST1-like protein n=1 Tax=Coptis chinensis TaxID=261450 RepID=A0A835H4K6_9MAGN|nr:hypothetical protein IFM89_020457 [Coptis chinensis]
MGKRLDALLGRNFKTTKFKSLVNLAISRLAVLKNQRQVRCSQARSDTSQLLNLGHQDRALLRVEHVLKEQNMLDVFVMLEGYCHLLVERVVLIVNNKECPDELNEAISSLIFAASRCGEFPELQEIRSVFTSRFGKDFAARAIDLRNNCGVNRKIIQKLSTRHPSFENRMKVLQEIATENGITLHLEEEASVTAKEILNLNQTQTQNQPKTNITVNMDNAKNGDQTPDVIEEMDQIEGSSGSLRTRKRYSDVASAAQAAFESAAYAAAAARAAVELSQDNYPNDRRSPAPRRRNRSDSDGSSRSGIKNHVVGTASAEVENSEDRLGFEKIHSIENPSSESDGEEWQQNHKKSHSKNSKGRASKESLERSLSASSSDSAGDSTNETNIASTIQVEIKPSEKMAFDQSDNETENEYDYGALPLSDEYRFGVGVKSGLSTDEFPKARQNNTTDYEEEVHLKGLNIGRRPISVRTRTRNKR